MRLRLKDITCENCGENHIILDPKNLEMKCDCGKKWKIIPVENESGVMNQYDVAAVIQTYASRCGVVTSVSDLQYLVRRMKMEFPEREINKFIIEK